MTSQGEELEVIRPNKRPRKTPKNTPPDYNLTSLKNELLAKF